MLSLTDMLQVVAQTFRDVLPIAAILIAFQVGVLRRQPANPKQVLLGFAYVLLGLSLFLVGLEQAIFPLGKTMAAQLTAPSFLDPGSSGISATAGSGAYVWLYAFSFAVGFSTTMAEPSLIAVAIKAKELTAGGIGDLGLRIAVALGVAIGITLGVYRIIAGVPLQYFILTGYVVVIVQTFFAPKLIVPLAYDSGGVTTSTITVPLVAGLGLGLADSIPGRSPLIDGFGLIAFASLFPMITVMGYAQASEWLAAHHRSNRSSETTDLASHQEDPP